jgi:glycosyltransferase involved in cell wall biosynthesis
LTSVVTTDSTQVKDRWIPDLAVFMDDVTFIIPTMNEEQNLSHVLPGIPKEVEIILVDGNSRDNTVKTAKSLRPDVRILIQPGRGKGNAMRYGFMRATRDIIVTFDADGSFGIDEAARLIRPLHAGYHLVKGSRFILGGSTEDMPFVRRFGNRIFVLITNVLFGCGYTDLAYGLHAFRREILDTVKLTSDGFEIDTEFYIKTKKAGFKVLEVPSKESKRLNGSGKLRSVPDGWRILKTIVKARFQ